MDSSGTCHMLPFLIHFCHWCEQGQKSLCWFKLGLRLWDYEIKVYKEEVYWKALLRSTLGKWKAREEVCGVLPIKHQLIPHGALDLRWSIPSLPSGCKALTFTMEQVTSIMGALGKGLPSAEGSLWGRAPFLSCMAASTSSRWASECLSPEWRAGYLITTSTKICLIFD